jgi:hypothetical protein
MIDGSNPYSYTYSYTQISLSFCMAMCLEMTRANPQILRKIQNKKTARNSLQ